MPLSHSSPITPAVLAARELTHDRGGRTVLRRVSLSVGPQSCVGIIGPNGVGKSTFLQLLGGIEVPDSGTVTLDPPGATVGLLAQEHDRHQGETVRENLARRTGVHEAEARLIRAGIELASRSHGAVDRYERALSQFESLGAGSFDARVDSLLRELGVGGIAGHQISTLSGGQEAKVALAAMELSQFDIVLLDEPTNDLDFFGLQRLEQWVRSREGGTVIISHDRAFLERTVSSVLEIDEHSRTAREFGGGWSGYQAERLNAQRLASEAFEEYEKRRQQLTSRANRQRQWAEEGANKEVKNPRDNDKAQRDFRINRTENLAHKARQVDRQLESLHVVEKPFEAWDLHFSIGETKRAGAVVGKLTNAVVERGPFRLGPTNLEIGWGERVALIGANGSGKSTLVGALLGTLALSSGKRWKGPSVVTGVLGQDRQALSGDHDLAQYVGDTCGLSNSETRSLLAKFGLTATHVTRPTWQLSPGERTRAELAIFQGRGVNFLVLDEPTNHLDLPAIEQLESALRDFTGTLLLVSHDRQLLDAVAITRTIEMVSGSAHDRGPIEGMPQ
ncbi:MAG: ABC-F family ATP-binding cassette domain-containing protein [Acidimicrobiales bacterium]